MGDSDGFCGKERNQQLVCQPHTFHQNNQTIPPGLNRNVWNYDVVLNVRNTVNSDKILFIPTTSKNHSIHFQIQQLLPNGENRDVSAKELMLMHDRLVHVVLGLVDREVENENYYYWHVHPDEFGDVGDFNLEIEFPLKGTYFVAFDFMHNIGGLMRFASVT